MVTINDQIESIAKSVCKQSFHWMANPKALTKLAPDFSKAQMINGELVEVQINDVGVALADVFDDADREAEGSHGPGWTTSGGEDKEEYQSHHDEDAALMKNFTPMSHDVTAGSRVFEGEGNSTSDVYEDDVRHWFNQIVLANFTSKFEHLDEHNVITPVIHGILEVCMST